MPRLRHHWGGNTSSAAIAAIAQAESEAQNASSSEDEDDHATQEVDVYGVLRALLEERMLVQARMRGGRSIGKKGRLSSAKGPKAGQAAQRAADAKSIGEGEDEGNVEELGEFIEVSNPISAGHAFRAIGLYSGSSISPMKSLTACPWT